MGPGSGRDAPGGAERPGLMRLSRAAMRVREAARAFGSHGKTVCKILRFLIPLGYWRKGREFGRSSVPSPV